MLGGFWNSFFGTSKLAGIEVQFTRRRLLGGSAAASLALLSGCAATTARRASYAATFVKPANMNPVFYWTDIVLQAVRDEKVSPPLAARAFAMGHTAGFLAVNGLEPRYRSRYQVGEGPRSASSEVAFGTAFASAISRSFRGGFSQDQSRFLAAYPDGQAKSDGVGWGQRIGRHMIGLRHNDGVTTAKNRLRRYPGRNDILQWARTGPHYNTGSAFAERPTYAPALLPGFGAVKPWALNTVSSMRAVDFPEAQSRAFAREYLEIFETGRANSRNRTVEQSQIALFWEDGPGSVTPPGHIMALAMQVLQYRNQTLVEQARAFSLLSMSMADAATCSWDSKYHHDIARPETMIRERAQRIANSHATLPLDPNWQSFIPSPSFPAYTSGHSCFAGAGFRMLARLTGKDRVAFSSVSPDPQLWPGVLPGMVRSWSSFSQAAEECGISRIYGGVHWNADNTQGLKVGRRIADTIFSGAIPAAA